MRGLDWRGITAAILASGVFAVLIVGDVFAGLNDYRVVSAEEVATVSTVLGAAVGAIAVYLGTKARPRNDPRGEPGSSPETDPGPPLPSTLPSASDAQNRSGRDGGPG